jgi:hypothetical protein
LVEKLDTIQERRFEMTKHTKIGLMLLVTLVLLLALAVPALANNHSHFCVLQWRGYDERFETYDEQIENSFTNEIPGDATIRIHEKHIYKTCTGQIPLGEKSSTWFYNFDLQNMVDYLYFRFGTDPESIDINNFSIGPAETGGGQMSFVYQGESLESDNWSLSVDNETGEFKLQSWYTP